MSLMDEFKWLAEEEKKSYDEYVSIAQRAESVGMRSTADSLRRIAQEELKHSITLMALHAYPEPGLHPTEVEEIKLSGKMVEVKLERPFPQTYGDWVNVAEDIKKKDPTVGTTAWVNMALQHISDEDEDAGQSKRWLMQKADELGIK